MRLLPIPPPTFKLEPRNDRVEFADGRTSESYQTETSDGHVTVFEKVTLWPSGTVLWFVLVDGGSD